MTTIYVGTMRLTITGDVDLTIDERDIKPLVEMGTDGASLHDDIAKALTNGKAVPISGAVYEADGATIPATFGRMRIAGDAPAERIDLTTEGEQAIPAPPPNPIQEHFESLRERRRSTPEKVNGKRHPWRQPVVATPKPGKDRYLVRVDGGAKLFSVVDAAKKCGVSAQNIYATFSAGKASVNGHAIAKVYPEQAETPAAKPAATKTRGDYLVSVDGGEPMTTKEAAKLIGCSYTSFYAAFNRGSTKLKGHTIAKVGGDTKPASAPALHVAQQPTAPEQATAPIAGPTSPRQSADYGDQVKCGKCAWKPPVRFELSRGCLECHTFENTRWIPVGQDADDEK